MANAKIYERVTARFIEALKTGAPPWVKDWEKTDSRPQRPVNAVTERQYSGVNVTILWTAATANDYKTERWLTYHQARKAGGHVKKGSKGTVAVLYKEVNLYRKDDDGNRIVDDNGEFIKEAIKFMRGFTLFNVEQCENLPQKVLSGNPGQAVAKPAWNSHSEIDDLVEKHGITVRHRCNCDPAYFPGQDVIKMPVKESFKNESAYYSTLLHEMTHWTGHESRLNRPGIARPFDSNKRSYAFEELIAEIGSAFLCSEFGIQCNLRHESYILSWIEDLENDPATIFETSALAWKARTFLMGE